MEPQAPAEHPGVCQRCGTCCRRSSPTLHLQDLARVQAEQIPWSHLVTLRRGEPVRSPFEAQPFELEEEQIKLRERPGGHTCSLLDDSSATCLIYVQRPVQCRAQTCWDPTEAEDLAETAHLTRQHLLASFPTIWALVEEHERRCAFSTLSTCIDALRSEQGDPQPALELLCFDESCRELAQQKLAVPEAALDLLFGRRLDQLVALFGLQVARDPQGIRTLRLVEPVAR